MKRCGIAGLRGLVLAVGIGTAVVAAGSAEEISKPKTVRIGLVGSLFRDIPEPMARALMEPFGALMQSQTGLSGELVQVPGPDALGRQLARGQVELGVFHGFEFAWARTTNPGLRPLMIAVNQQRHLRAYVVVGSASGISTLADLRGKGLALPHGTREHCRLFLDRRCEACGPTPERFFSRLTTPANLEDALDDVVDNLVQATVVDGVALESFKRRKPARFARLKVIQESEVFPAAVVAYQPGTLDEATLERFRSGLVNARKTALGRQLLTLWKLTGFEPVPNDYEQTLAAIAKAYPPPGAKAAPR
jgi:ABC-type phosphate/phosphonate transport system substrate-binding protein